MDKRTEGIAKQMEEGTNLLLKALRESNGAHLKIALKNSDSEVEAIVVAAKGAEAKLLDYLFRILDRADRMDGQ